MATTKEGRTGRHQATPPKRKHKSPLQAIRWDETERAKVQRAAVVVGLTVSDFVREAALARANRVLATDQHVEDLPHVKPPKIVALPDRLAAASYRERRNATEETDHDG